MQHPFVIQNMTLRDKFSIGEMADEQGFERSEELLQKQLGDGSQLVSINSMTSNELLIKDY